MSPPVVRPHKTAPPRRTAAALALLLLVPGLPALVEADVEPEAELRIVPVGDSISAGAENAAEPQATYRMFLHDHLVGSGLVAGTGFDLVGPYDSHPSTTYDYLRQDEWDHDSLAVSGWQTSNVKDELGPATATYDPDVPLILVGVNDVRAGVSSTVAAANIEAAILAARAERDDVKILIAEISPTTTTYDQTINAYNTLLRDLATEFDTTVSPIATVDMFTGYDPDQLHYDGLHPNEEGDELLASRWADALNKAFGVGGPWIGAACDVDAMATELFTDVDADLVHAGSIRCTSGYGIVQGRTDGTFDTDGTVTRGQQASMIARLIEVLGGQLPQNPISSLTDVAGTTHELRIAQLEAIGVVQGQADGTFLPSQPVNRAQTAALLARAWAHLTRMSRLSLNLVE